jgi:2-polyprenyl-3-methyl-5-hydroxy-6-metoxy-1,4-benzoquinol methylase
MASLRLDYRNAGNDEHVTGRARGEPTYDRFYYLHYMGSPDSGGEYSRSEHWLRFFGYLADRMVADIGPGSALDAGCAMGILVESLRDRGVEAYGLDVSDYALERVREDVKPYCTNASVVAPLPRRYDLIICIETLEHLAPFDAERAVANICAHTDDVIFSSTPGHFKEPTHLNVRPPSYWAELFARHGLERDLDYDVSGYIAPWAVRFRRQGLSVPRLTAGYERLIWPLKQENTDLRGQCLESQADLARTSERLEAAEAQARSAAAEITALRASSAWRIGSRVVHTLDRLLPPGTRRRAAARWFRAGPVTRPSAR